MYFFQIKEILTDSDQTAVDDEEYQYVAVLNQQEYMDAQDIFRMGLDIDLRINNLFNTKAVVNYNSLAGTLDIPKMPGDLPKNNHLAFMLDGDGIVFVDNDDYTLNVVRRIQATRKWRFPSLERFIYDFLEETIAPDPEYLERLERELEHIEDLIMDGEIEKYPAKLNDVRSDLLEMHTHYDHMIDLAKELEENENEFFHEDNLRYFRLLGERCQRLQDTVSELRDYIVQLRDLVSEQLAIKQNHIMTLLTVITAIFMPLTLIVGWYGMNFVNMPELYSPYGYPLVIIISFLIVVLSLLYFKKRKWL